MLSLDGEEVLFFITKIITQSSEPPMTEEGKRIRKMFYDKLVKRLGKEFMDAPSPYEE